MVWSVECDAGRSSYSARRRVSAPEDAYPRLGYRLRSMTSATTRRTSGGRDSYRSRAQIAKIVGDSNGLIHRPGRAWVRKTPAQPVNKSGQAIRRLSAAIPPVTCPKRSMHPGRGARGVDCNTAIASGPLIIVSRFSDFALSAFCFSLLVWSGTPARGAMEFGACDRRSPRAW